MEKETMKEIYSGTLWEAEMVKSLLQAEGIDSFLKNSVLSSYAYEPIQSQGVQVMVSSSDMERAQAVVDGYTGSK